MRVCNRCGLPVSPGICAPTPHVFHDRAEDCVAALRADLARAHALVAEMAAKLRFNHDVDSSSVCPGLPQCVTLALLARPDVVAAIEAARKERQ